MKEYLAALEHVLERGKVRSNRTGIDTLQVFGYQMRFNLQDGFPAVTTKQLAWKSVVSELLWFIEGSTDERRLCEILHNTRSPDKKTIWTANADNQGVALGYENNNYCKELGPVYGSQWRNFADPNMAGLGKDQLATVINQIRNEPESRRIIMSAWNPLAIDKMALPPCHVMSQFMVSDGKLSCMMTQRSVDMGLGLPFNIASYALLTHMIAQVTGLVANELIISTGDTHVYVNHIEQLKEQLRREPLAPPTLWLNPEITDIDKFTMNDISLVDYNYLASIGMDMAV